MTPPEIAGIHHVTLTVSNVAASIAWYRDVLGFEVQREVTQGELTKALLSRSGVRVTMVAHGDKAVPGPFTERRVGLDHLSFAVADRAALDAWAAHLDAAGATRSPLAEGSTGSLIAFRDPDNIALEFYTL